MSLLVDGSHRIVPERLRRYRHVALAFLCLSLVTLSVDATSLVIALPDIQRGLHASNSQQQWICASYTIVFACLLLPAGAIGDRYGRDKTLAAGLAWFGVFSLLAALSRSPSELIGARVAMGIGAAAIMPTTMSILSQTVFPDPKERLRAISIWAAVIGAGLALGPVVGGVLVKYFGWNAVFLINVPIVAIALIGGHLFIPPSRAPGRRRNDPVGNVLCIIGLVSLMIAVIEAPNVGWSHPSILLAFAIAIVALVLFARWEHRNPEPMLDLALFRNLRFTAANVAMTLAFFALMGALFLLTQYMQNVLSYSPAFAGLMTLPLTLTLIIGAPISAILDRRVGTRVAVATAFTLITISLILLATFGTETQKWQVLVTSMILGTGLGLAMTPTTNAIQGALPNEKAGIGSAMNDMTRQVGGALGIAVLGSVMNTIYISQLTAFQQHLPPALTATLEPKVLDEARRSMSAALKSAGQFPGADAAVRAAFVSGQRIAMIVAAVATAAGLFIVLRYLPARATSEPQ